jgi:hypothetical protein
MRRAWNYEDENANNHLALISAADSHAPFKLDGCNFNVHTGEALRGGGRRRRLRRDVLRMSLHNTSLSSVSKQPPRTQPRSIEADQRQR